MIYLVYFTKESGELIWSFRHPLSPTELIAKVVGKDDVLISGFISAISGFGSETLGDKLQSIDFERVRLYFRYMQLGDENILVTVVSDKEDAPIAIWNTIRDFMEKNKKILMELGGELSLLDTNRFNKLVAKLNKSMMQYLESKKREIELLAHRDFRTIAIGLIPSIAVFFLMFLVTQWLSNTYKLVPGPNNPGNVGALIAIIVFLMFIIPSLIMGFTIGYREGTRFGGLGLGALGIVLLAFIYWDFLVNWAAGLNLPLYYLPFLLAIVIFVLGSAMASLGGEIAWYFVEQRTLVPPKEKEILEEIEGLEFGEKEAEEFLERVEEKDKVKEKRVEGLDELEEFFKGEKEEEKE